MKHFYTFSIAIFAMFSSQLLFAQTSSSPDNGEGLIASRSGFNSSVFDLNNRNEFSGEKPAAQAFKNEMPIEDHSSSFSITSSRRADEFEANFQVPKSGKAELSIRTASGQVIYEEKIDIVKGSNSHLIKTEPLNSGIYFVSLKNDQVNYNGKIQKI